MCRNFFCGFVFCCALGTFASALQASYIYPLEIFTNNGNFCDSLLITVIFATMEI